MQRYLLFLFLNYSVIELFHHPLLTVFWYHSGGNYRIWTLNPHQAFFIVFLASTILALCIDILMCFILLKVFFLQY